MTGGFDASLSNRFPAASAPGAVVAQGLPQLSPVGPAPSDPQSPEVKPYTMPEGETVFGQYRKAVYDVDESIPVKEWGEWQQEFSELNPGTDDGNFVLAGQTVSLPSVLIQQQVSVDENSQVPETWRQSPMGKKADVLLDDHNITDDQKPTLESAIYNRLNEIKVRTSDSVDPEKRESPEKISFLNTSAVTEVISKHISAQDHYKLWKDQPLGSVMSSLLDKVGITEITHRDYLLPLLYGRSDGKAINEATKTALERGLIEFNRNYPSTPSPYLP
jgi:hypothetical protein